MKIIAFGASTSKHSINKEFAAYVAHTLAGTNDHVEVLDLNDYPLPLFSVDLEKETGVPQAAKTFIDKLQEADLLVVSMAEHNGAYTAAFKNLLDWASRHKANVFDTKHMLLLSTSPGARGGKGSLEAALGRFPRHGAVVLGSFSLPSFNDNYQKGSGIMDETLAKQLAAMLEEVRSKLQAEKVGD
jgi:chromate reductase